jgi:general stress protein YciG
MRATVDASRVAACGWFTTVLGPGSDVPFIGLKAWRGPGKVRTLETFIPAERFMFRIINSREETMALATEMPKKSSTSTRGFASMDREKQLAIARKGGESVPNEKRSFSQNHRLAAEAGRKGGQSVNPAKRSFSRNHTLASEAGRKGGHASHSGPNKPAA